MKLTSRTVFSTLVIVGLSLATYQSFKTPPELPVVALIVQKDLSADSKAMIWLNAAKEEGVPVELMNAEDYVQTFSASVKEVVQKTKCLILPDRAATLAHPSLVSFLDHYVAEGGKLVLVSDALTQTEQNRYLETLPFDSIFSFPAIEGFMGKNPQMQMTPIRATAEWIKALAIPPGLFTEDYFLSNYQAKHALYPHWPTRHDVKEKNSLQKIKPIFTSPEGDLVAGLRRHGKGEVLWLNLPLGYLKTQTDGLLLHSFLKWIGESWLSLPILLRSPNGIGGMILNVHVDSNAALASLENMKKLGTFKEGPFSIHVTAGPDAREIGDKLGLDVEHNLVIQKWIKEWVSTGHEVGAHGGWIHDYFGKNITDTKTDEMEFFLQKNLEVMKAATGKNILEYSAPIGNHPVWVTEWLEKRGYSAYYFTGNAGIGPTQTFRGEVQTDHTLWSFPVSTFQQVASFEEAETAQVPGSSFLKWLSDVIHYVADQRTVRLFYFHPPGVHLYQKELLAWFSEIKKLKKAGQFQWYTMKHIAEFMTARNEVKWSMHLNELRVDAHAELKNMVWSLPQNSKVLIKSGKVKIENNLLKPEDSLGFVIEVN